MTRADCARLVLMLASRCGYSADLSGPVNDRAMFHIDNAYYLEHVEITSHRCKTHTVSNTAFRGFGGPQGMMVIEAVLDEHRAHARPRSARCPAHQSVRHRSDRNVTHYGQVGRGQHAAGDFRSAGAQQRLSPPPRRRDRRWNAAEPVIKRGLALTPVKFGIAFTSTLFNQAGALLQVYTDGTVLLNHGGTEMGQGLHVKVAQVVAAELGLPLSAIRISATDTSKVPNTSATAASSGSDLNGKAAQAAAVTVRRAPRRRGVREVRRRRRGRALRGRPRASGRAAAVPFAAPGAQPPTRRACRSRRRAYYRTPKIHWDKRTPSAAGPSIISPSARRSPKWRWIRSPARRNCCASTSCTTWAPR